MMLRRIALLTAIWLAAGAAIAQDRSGMAVGILNQVNMARQAAAAHDQTAALSDVKQALSLANGILQQAAAEPKPVLVTISRDTETTTTYRPVKKLKHGEFTADRMKHDTSVRDVETTGTSQQLDISGTADRLQQAQAALERQDWSTADQTLGQIQQSVLHVSVAQSMPLLGAQQNLELARARILEDKSGAAAAPLRAAAQALADFERSAPGPDAEKAEEMRQQMLQRADRIHHDHADAVDWINLWLGTITEWEQKVSIHH